MKFTTIILLISLFCSCGSKNKEKGVILSKEKMQVVLWDIIVANSFTQQFIKKDSLKNPVIENSKLQLTIFKMHNISKDDFYKSYHHYTSQPEFMMTLLDSITARGEREKANALQVERKISPSK